MKAYRGHSRWFMAALLAVAAACSSHSPTEPTGTPANPKVPASTPTYNITVTARPGSLTIGSSTGSTITIQATSTSDGSAPPNLTPVVLTTTLGEFNSIGSGQQSLTLQLVNGKASAILYPGTSAGTATVGANIVPGTTGACSSAGATPACAGSGATSVQINSNGTFFLNSVTPNTGDPSGGYPVTIAGGGFIAPVSVTFAGSNAAVTGVHPNSITVIAPASTTAVPVGTTLPVSISVSNNIGGTAAASATLSNAFTYVPGGGGVSQPVIFSVTPASGSNQGGTVVTINGQGFVAPVQVLFGAGSTAASFNGVEATITSVTATKIVVVAPAAQGFGQNNTNQLVSILVKNINNGFSTISPSAYKYGSKVLITSVGPTQTVYNQPVQVTIYGQGFEDPVAVTLDGFAAQVLNVSGTEIQVMSPVPQVSSCSTISGPVSVTNINTGDSATGPTFFFQVFKPVVTNLSPGQGPGSGHTPVQISGGSFSSSDSVTIGGAPAIITNVTTSQISITTPQFTGTYLTQACTSGTSAGTQEEPTPEPVVVTDQVTTCTVTINNAFIYTPASNACVVTPPPVTAPVAAFTFQVAPDNMLEVLFSDGSSNSPTAWTWTFGDPASGSMNASNLQDPVHTFSSAGTYVVTLKASNSAGSSSTSQFVTVPPP